MTGPAATAPDTVLVALDGSPAAATALPVARAVARQLGAGLEALHVDLPGTNTPDEPRWLANADPPPDDVQLRRPSGDPSAEILREATRAGVALLVLTTHGRQIEPGRQLGNVAETVIRAAIRPVLLVRPEGAVDVLSRSSEPWRLLLPLDGVPRTSALVLPAIQFAKRLGATIDILYVAGNAHAPRRERGGFGAPAYVDQPQHEWGFWASEVVHRLQAALGGGDVLGPVRVFLARGHIGEQIARFAAERNYDALVLVRQSGLEVGRARVLRNVLDHTPIPVLLLGA